MPDDDFVLTSREEKVAQVRLNRPAVLNALSPDMMAALAGALEALDADPEIRAIVVTGGLKVFAAGADISMMASASPQDMVDLNTRASWRRISRLNKPLIAAVSGYAYGGGCELAMNCDLIIASETARFAQPEIKLGIMPGAGGTQRLAKALGPYRAMEMVLTGDPLTAEEAFEFGLINRLVPVERVVETAMELGHLIASRPPVAIQFARDAVRHGVENTLREGLEIERRNFLLLFDTMDQAEGMAAFLEKREAQFKGE